MNTVQIVAANGHMAIVNGSIVDATFECEPEQLSVLTSAIKTFLPLLSKEQPYTGSVTLIELLSYIGLDYDLNNPLIQEMTACMLAVHHNSVTIH